MHTTLSFSVPTTVATRTKKIAKQRGFKGVSEYLRHLILEDDMPLISAETLIKRHAGVGRLAKQGKLIEAESLADFL